jgi:hypothetical protein
VTELAPTPTSYDNKEPAAMLLGTDTLELYFGSNRADGWHIWSKGLTPTAQGGDEQITSGQFTQRAPAVLKVSNQTVRLWFRNNQSQIYTSSLYPAAQTIDARYSGSTTVDTRNPAKISLRRNIQDVQHYTYDTGLEETDWYMRNTVGIYLTPDTDDQKLVVRNQNLIKNVLKRFLPIQVRAVFIIQQAYEEFIYTYDSPEADPQYLIGEQMIDTISGEVYTGLEDSYFDRAGFRWLGTWITGQPQGTLPDLSVTPPDLSFRLVLKGVSEGK